MTDPVTSNHQQTLAHPGQVHLHGVLGQALEANRRGRLSHFITGPDSPAIRLFDPACRCCNEAGHWYGEHAGKWLSAAARAAVRSDDAELGANVMAVADYLLSVQEADGYLGTDPPHRRFTVPQPVKPENWNGEPALRTWDVWTHSGLLLGLMEVYRCFGHERHLDAARRIGDLCWRTFCERGLDITTVGNHHGLSATVLIDPAVELYVLTGEPRYLELAERVLAQANANPRLALLERVLAGADPSEIATGKAYQLCWNLLGLAKLYRVTGRAELRQGLERQWQAICEHHLSLGGGPFGGIGQRSREVFNPAFVFDPSAYVETCAISSWIQLNRELLVITGDPRYAEEIERSACNDLLGAQSVDGKDWCYYSYANGRRIHTSYWRCCKSSGALALEELPAIAYASDVHGIVVNLFGPGEATLPLPVTGHVVLRQRTRYPFNGEVHLQLMPDMPARFRLRLRIPAWAKEARLSVAGTRHEHVTPGGYADIDREWRPGDTVTLILPMHPQIHRRVYRNVQTSHAPDSSPVRQQVLYRAWVAFSRGPLVYATGLIDGYKTDEIVRLCEHDPAIELETLPADEDESAACLRLHLDNRAPIDFHPYYGLGGRQDRIWRLTWLGLAPCDNGVGSDDCGVL